MEVSQDVRTICTQLQSSFRHFHDWSRSFQHDKFVGVDSRLCLAVRDTVRKYSRGSRLNGVSVTGEAFLDRTSLMILADDLFGK